MFYAFAILLPWIAAVVSTIIVHRVFGNSWWVYLIYACLVCSAHTLLVIQFAASA